jgi:L-threonylcarbamoyladenylate synthase
MQILKIKQINLKEIVKSIKQGKVIICPTDTVYGLIADATNKKAVEKIFKIKKRPLKKPIPIFVRNLKQAKKIAKINKEQERFLKSTWPGKVTGVLKIKKTKIKIYGIEKDTIALRIPKYKLVNELLKKTNKPLTGTSANLSGKPPSTKIKEVVSQFKNQKHQPDLIINMGNLRKSKPSTILDLRVFPPKILRI